MLGAIFLVKGAKNFTGRGGTELDILLLAGCLVIIVIGPGRISVSYILRRFQGSCNDSLRQTSCLILKKLFPYSYYVVIVFYLL